MKKILILALSFLSLSASSLIQKDYLLQLQKETRILNSSLPISYGEGMELSYASLNKNYMTYTILVNKLKLEKESSIVFDSTNIHILKKFIVSKYRNTIVANLCKDPKIKNILESGIKYNYEYKFNSGEDLGIIEIDNNSCD